MKAFLRLLKWLVVLALLVGGGYFLKTEVLAPKPVPVELIDVERGLVERTVTNSRAGTVRVRREAGIRTEITGRIVELPFQEGDRVEKGDLLIRLDGSSAGAALAVAEEALATAAAELAEIRTRRKQAAYLLERKEALLSSGAIQEELVIEYRHRLEALEAGVQAAEARVESARAAVRQAGVEAGKVEVRAPFAGVVSKRIAEVGELASPLGSTGGAMEMQTGPVLELVDLSQVYVSAEIDEVDMGRLEVGLPVRITLDPFPDRSFDGRVVRVAETVSDIQEKNRTVEIEVEFDAIEPGDVFRPGTSADVEVILEALRDVVRLPAHVLLEGNRVLMLEGGRLVARKVEIGLRNWDFAEVKDGLRVGDRVVTNLDREDIVEGALAVPAEQ